MSRGVDYVLRVCLLRKLSFRIEPKEPKSVSSHECIISTDLTILLLTILIVLHFTPLLWSKTRSNTPGPTLGMYTAAEGPTANGSGTEPFQPRHLTSWLPPFQVSLVDVAAVVLTMSLVLGQVFVWLIYSLVCHFP